MKTLVSRRPALLPAALLIPVLLCACSSRMGTVDFSRWFNRESEVLVSEVNSSNQCNSPQEQTSIDVLPDSRAVKAWESARGLSLSGSGELPVGPYIVIDLGKRNTGGYGLAVSRQAGLRDELLVLKATLFEPREGAVSTQALTSPCALVRLPSISFKSLRLIDQAGKVRASGAGYTVGP